MDVPRRCACAPGAPEREARVDRSVRDGQRRRDGEATVAAAAADGLGKNAGRLVAERCDRAHRIDLDVLRLAAVARAATHRQAERRVLRAAGRNREAAVAAAAARRLRDDAVRLEAGGRYAAETADRDIARIAAVATAAAEAEIHRGVGCAARRDGEAPVAACATNRLGDDAIRQ